MINVPHITVSQWFVPSTAPARDRCYLHAAMGAWERKNTGAESRYLVVRKSPVISRDYYGLVTVEILGRGEEPEIALESAGFAGHKDAHNWMIVCNM